MFRQKIAKTLLKSYLLLGVNSMLFADASTPIISLEGEAVSSQETSIFYVTNFEKVDIACDLRIMVPLQSIFPSPRAQGFIVLESPEKTLQSRQKETIEIPFKKLVNELAAQFPHTKLEIVEGSHRLLAKNCKIAKKTDRKKGGFIKSSGLVTFKPLRSKVFVENRFHKPVDCNFSSIASFDSFAGKITLHSKAARLTVNKRDQVSFEADFREDRRAIRDNFNDQVRLEGFSFAMQEESCRPKKDSQGVFYEVTEDSHVEPTYDMEKNQFTFGTITHNQISGFQMKPKKTYVSFEVEVSSEKNYDKVVFFLDGEPQKSWSGEKKETYQIKIPEGTRLLSWKYIKDDYESKNRDTGFIRNITFSDKAKSYCPENYVLVGKNEQVGVKEDFCIMKYEAKRKENGDFVAISKPEDTPWVGLGRTDANLACEKNGPDYFLMSNYHWQALAREIEQVDENWQLSANARSYKLKAGNSLDQAQTPIPVGPDDEYRSHKLLSGDIIYDAAGNVWEQTSTRLKVDKDFGLELGIYELTDENHIRMFGPKNTYDSPSHLGWLLARKIQGGIKRGGGYGMQDKAGVFSARLTSYPQDPGIRTGFRCVTKPAD